MIIENVCSQMLLFFMFEHQKLGLATIQHMLILSEKVLKVILGHVRCILKNAFLEFLFIRSPWLKRDD